MSVWYEQVSEEGLRWAAIVDGGRVNPCHEHFMANSREEARAWVDAAYIRKNAPKVKKPIEPITTQQPDVLGNLYIPVSVEQWQELSEPTDWPITRKASPLAETATGDQTGSALPSAVESLAREEMGVVKRRGRPPKVSA